MLIVWAAAWAGYGDVEDSRPSAAERWLHLWTNAARVAPEEFEDDYAQGGCSLSADFSADERSPKAPLYLDVGLAEAARYHSEDMASEGCFQHESCDGTDTWARIGRYYDEGSTLGENIALGQVDGRYAVLSMWMCSESGHRANIMSSSFNELGTGVAEGTGATLFTQDFAQGQVPEGQPVRIAAHDGSSFYADWGDASPPTRLELVLDGQEREMKLAHGAPEQGVYHADSPVSACVSWWVEWETESGQSGFFPEEGAYFAGSGCEADWALRADAGSSGHDDEADEEDGGSGLKVVGCTTAPSSPGWWLTCLILLSLRPRRP